MPALHRDLVRGAQQRPEPGLSNSSALARNRTRRPRRSATHASVSGSRYETWLLARIDRARASGCAPRPRSSTASPHRRPGQNTPFATEYTGVHGSVAYAAPCRPGAVPTTAGVVVPLRSFALGKARLAAALDDDARAALARAMAERVVAAAGRARS